MAETVSAGASAPATGRTAASLDLAERVSAHMLATFPESPCGGWEVARDTRDNTAAVVWRAREMFGGMQGVRGTMLYRWLCSLRDAGFTAQPRLDEAFGRPDETSAIAHWLHVTAWTAPAADGEGR